MELGVSLTRIVILIFQISQVSHMECLRGAGDTFYTAMVSLTSVTVIRTVGAYVGGYVLHLGIAKNTCRTHPKPGNGECGGSPF